MDVTDEDLDRLLELSDLDARIARIGATLGDLPEQRAVVEAEQRRRGHVEAGDALRAELETARGGLRRSEREVDQYRERLDVERARLYGGEVTNAKQSKSVEAEITATERRIEEAEEAMLEAMQAAEELEEAIEAEAREVGNVDGELETLGEARDVAAGSLIAEQAELEVERDRLREALTAPAVEAYDGVRERVRAGAAVGELSNGSCTSCRIELPSSEINDLRAGDSLTTCPNCRRLLVVR